MSRVHVAVVGAGPAGLCLANSLHRAGIDVVVFEGRSEKEHLARQGGSVDLYPSRGIAALRAAGLLDSMLEVARTKTKFRICDKRLVAWLAIPPSGKPEIDREDLVRVMVQALPPDTVRWGCRLVELDDKRRLHFQDGHVEQGKDLVVGADGAWSKVRRHLTAATPVFSRMLGQMMTIPMASKSGASLLRAMSRGSGSVFAFSDGKAFIVHILRNDCASITLFQVATEAKDKVLEPFASSEAELRRLQEGYSNWHADFRELLDQADPDTLRSWPLHMLPAEFRWQHQEGVTLIGDAAHLMPPSGGYGVNLALDDARKLSEAIEKVGLAPPETHRAVLDNVLRAFEVNMMETALELQQASMKILEYNMMTEGAPRTTIEKSIMLRAQHELQPRIKLWPLLRPLLACAVYAYYGVFKLLH